MRSVIASRQFQEAKMELPVALGKTTSNEPFVFDLTQMPHLLIAGSAGQGISVGLNVIITSILYKKHPSQVKFILVDTKSIDFTLYEIIERHFLAKLPDAEDAIISDNKKVIDNINSLCIEMDSRYSLFRDAGVRNIKEYNTKFIARKLNPNLGHRYMPYIVMVIDDYAELVTTVGEEIETAIIRLAQKAHLAGIHLIIATQRHTSKIITKAIKINFHARIVFRIISQIEARTVLDSASQLTGCGDLLFTSDGVDLTRVQCAFIDTDEINNITRFIGQQQGYPTAFLLPEHIDSAEPQDVDLSKKDNLFDDAARLMVIHQQGSTSLIQRKFSIGFNRAGRIMEQLEVAGIVGHNEGGKARQVLFTDMKSLENYLTKINNQWK
jgi:S-DNA-T family DNA segregation ATPase FtsK/SpoIIIE